MRNFIMNLGMLILIPLLSLTYGLNTWGFLLLVAMYSVLETYMDIKEYLVTPKLIYYLFTLMFNYSYFLVFSYVMKGLFNESEYNNGTLLMMFITMVVVVGLISLIETKLDNKIYK